MCYYSVYVQGTNLRHTGRWRSRQRPIRGHYTRPGPVLPIISTLLFFFDLSLHIFVIVSVIGLFPVQHSVSVFSMTSFTNVDNPVCNSSVAISPLDVISSKTRTSTWAMGINSNVRPLSLFAFGRQQQRGMVRMIRAGQSLVVVATNYY